MTFYQFARGICLFYLKIVRGFKVEGLENLPQQGPVIVVANHVSYMDPVAIGCALNRQVHYLAKEELFSLPVLGWIISHLGTFPVKRGSGDRGAIRACLEVLQTGECFGIFPEGTRNKGRILMPFKSGAALLAAKTGAPLLPIALLGTKGFSAKITVRIGPTINYPPQPDTGAGKTGLDDFSQQLRTAVEKLLRR